MRTFVTLKETVSRFGACTSYDVTVQFYCLYANDSYMCPEINPRAEG